MKKEEFEFIHTGYKPKDDLVCLFRVEPNRISFKKAANTIALESSVGTWTKLNSKKERDVKKHRAKVFSIKKPYIKVAYPSSLFEPDNVPNILSSIAGNIFGMKAVKNLKLEDISLPKSIIIKYKGPKYGIKGIRKMMKIKSRPLIGTIIKPKLGLKTKEHAESAYESWIGGCDIVKDDENLSSQKFNEFEKRLAKTLEMQDKAESETGEKKAYLINVTAETKEMIKRAGLAEKQGSKYVMIDILTSGWAALQTLRQAEFKMGIHAYRAMHAAFDRNEKHGINMMVIADFARLIGVDNLHIGTGIGKMKDSMEVVQDRVDKRVKETRLRLQQNWDKLKPVFAVCSGGLYPGHVPFLIKNYGKDIIIQAGGGIHWNPRGSKYGAMGMKQALNATLKGISLKEYSKAHLELKEALDKFGYPREK